MKKIMQALSFLLVGALLAGAAFAENNDIAAKWQALNEALDKDPNISADTKAALKDFSKAVMDQMSAEKVPAGTREKIEQWFADEKNLKRFQDFFGTGKDKGFLDRFKVSGDFRLRFEDTTNAGSTSGDPSRRDRARYRARLRIGAEYEIAPTAWIGARLVTGARNEQQSANQTMGTDFSKWEVNLDRLYLHWQPFAVSPLKLGDSATYDPHIWLGKFGHPFKSTNLMWYSDVQPEGFALVNSFKKVGCLDEVQFNLASYVLTEDADQQDAWIGAAQFVLVKKFDVGLPDKIQLTWAESYYKIKDTTNNADKSEILNNAGGTFKNPPTATAAGRLQSEYELIDSLLELRYNAIEVFGKKRPLVVTFNYIYNAGARRDRVNLDGKQDKAFIIGAALGDATKKGDWRIGADFVHSERDGVFRPISINDWEVNTNFNGFDAYFEYAVWDNVAVKIWALWDSPIKKRTTTGFDAGGNPNAFTDEVSHFKFRIEVNVKF